MYCTFTYQHTQVGRQGSSIPVEMTCSGRIALWKCLYLRGTRRFKRDPVAYGVLISVPQFAEPSGKLYDKYGLVTQSVNM